MVAQVFCDFFKKKVKMRETFTAGGAPWHFVAAERAFYDW
jgi:hypothetical protein